MVPGLWDIGSDVVAHGRNCFTARGIFLDRGLNACLPRWQLDTSPLSYQGSPPGWGIFYKADLEGEVKSKSLSRVPTLCDPMGYTVQGILQARILQWVAFPFSRGSSQPRDPTQVPHIAGGFFTSWATREALEGEQMLNEHMCDHLSEDD